MSWLTLKQPRCRNCSKMIWLSEERAFLNKTAQCSNCGVRFATLKQPLYFPRCLVDDVILFLRTPWGKKKKVVSCPKCGIMYARSAIKDSDPQRWNRTRERNLYDIHQDHNGRKILHHQGLGSRRIANPNVIEGPTGARTAHTR